jgi:Xaa-Pro aminopeptidase
MFDRKTYVQRRKQLKAAVGSGIILLLGNTESSMNYKDNLYPFRQDSSFLYFTGMDRPDLSFVIDIDEDAEILFGNDLTTEEIIWTGFREPLSKLCAKSGIHSIEKTGQLVSYMVAAVQKKRPIHFLPPYRPEHYTQLASLTGLPAGQLKEKVSVTLIKAVVAQRSYKSAAEVAEITVAVNTTIEMQQAAMRFAKPGMTEAQLAGRLQSIAIGNGGNLSFPTILTQNGQILHNGYSQAKLLRGNMVLCDCGAETGMHYAGDLTRTFPVNRKFSGLQKQIYDIVLAAHQSAVSMLAPGVLFRDVHLHACEKLTEGLQAMGIMKGNAKEAVENGAHALFFPCGLGHMMGLDTHDMENLGEQYVGYTDELTQSKTFGLKSLRLGRALEEGFVITVEPGLYFNPDLIREWAAQKKCTAFINYTALKKFSDVGGFRVEEDFLITGTGAKLLGKKLAKTTAEMEALRG